MEQQHNVAEGLGWDLLITQELMDTFLNSPVPVPFAGITKNGERVAVALNAAKSAGAPGVIGFGWHSEVSHTAAGLIEVVVPAVGQPSARRVEGPSSAPVRLQVYADGDRFARIEEIVNVPLLRKSTVTMLGCGALGSEMTRQLACAGVGNFHLFDADYLLPVNLPRHACDSRELFSRKTDAVQRLIQYRNPNAVVHTHHADITGNGYEELAAAIEQSDLVIATTDSNQAQFTANQICVRAQKPLLASGVWEQAFGGEVLWVFPQGSKLGDRFGTTCCYLCVFGQSRAIEATPEKKETGRPCSIGVAGRGHQGVGIDLLFTAQVALAYAIAMLDPDSPRARVLIENQFNLVYMHAGRPLEWAGVLRGPFDVQHKPVRIDPCCQVCGRMPSPQAQQAGLESITHDTR